MKYYVTLLVAWLLLSPPAFADVLEKGQAVNDAVTAMKIAGYKSTVLAMGPGDAYPYPEHNLHFWNVDEGYLSIIYSTTTGMTVRLNFVCHDERAKGDRKVFLFEVVSFDTDTGELLIKTRKGKAAERQRPLRGNDDPFNEDPPIVP